MVPGGGAMPVLRPGASQNVATGASSAPSTAVPNGIDVWRLVCNQDCRYNLAGAATATSTLLPGGVVEFIHVNPGDVLNVVQDTQAGSLNITDMS